MIFLNVMMKVIKNKKRILDESIVEVEVEVEMVDTYVNFCHDVDLVKKKIFEGGFNGLGLSPKHVICAFVKSILTYLCIR